MREPVSLIAKPLGQVAHAPRTPSTCLLNDNCLGSDGVARCDTCAIAAISPHTFDLVAGLPVPIDARHLGDPYIGRCGTVQLVELEDGTSGGILNGMFYPLVDDPSPEALAAIGQLRQLVTA